jgi:conjugal transfer pilus assembly protein TraD
VEPLLEELLEGHFVNLDGPGWDRDLANRMGNSAQGKGGFTRLTCMMQMYQEDKRSVSKPNETIEALIAMAMHSKEHYSKMIQVLEPLLEMLGSDEVGKLLSPDPADLSDNRQIWDSRRIIDDKCVLYIGLDSLSNSIIGSAIGSIILADLASVAGAIYNAGKKEDVFLFVDEAGEVVNEQLVQILNKAGGAGFKSFLACQTIADFEARMGSSAKAKQVLGNLNNAIVLRLRDTDTAEWVSNSFGTTMIRRENVSHSTGSESSSSFTEFKGTTNRSLQTTESALVDPSLFLRLPAMNYFAYLAGSTLYKGRVPLIEEEWKKAA